MSFKVIATEPFERKLKRLAKKHKSIASDLSAIIDQLEVDPIVGVAMGKDCYKIRVAISSKHKGKSGGARLITLVRFVNEIVFLMDIYDKSEQGNISDAELQQIIDLLSE